MRLMDIARTKPKMDEEAAFNRLVEMLNDVECAKERLESVSGRTSYRTMLVFDYGFARGVYTASLNTFAHAFGYHALAVGSSVHSAFRKARAAGKLKRPRCKSNAAIRNESEAYIEEATVKGGW